MNPLTKTLELVQQAKDGDSDALNRLFERYYERVRRSVRARLGAGLRANLDSGDVLQQTFMAAVRVFDRFEMRDEGSLIHWLSTLAERQIRDLADYHGAVKRDHKKERPLEMQTLEGETADLSAQLPADVTRPHDALESSEDQRCIDECVDQLSEQHRELIVLRDYEGVSWKEIAAITGRPSESAARNMHAKALLELSKLLRARGVGDD